MSAPRPGHLPPWIPACLGCLALAVFAALSLSTDAATRFYQWPWFFYWQVLLVIPPVLLLVRLFRAREGVARFGAWLDAGLVLLVAANVVSALLGPFVHQSLNAVLVPLAAASLGYVTLDWLERDPGRRAARIAILDRILGAGMAAFVLVSLGLWLAKDVGPFWSGHRTLIGALAIPNLEPLGHHVYTAGAAVLCLPWLAGLALTTPRPERTVWGTVTVLAFLDLATTSSRAGVAAVAVMLVAAAALRLHRVPVNRSRKILIAALTVIFVGSLAVRDPRTRSLLLHGHWSRIGAESNQQRQAMLEAGWLMGRDRPFTGYGPGTVALVYPRYRAQLSGGVENVLQLHDTPVQFWAQLGAPGVLAGLLLVAGIAGLAGAVWRRGGGGPGRALSLRLDATLVAFAGYGAFCLFDYQLNVPLFAVILATLLARMAADVPDAAVRAARRLPPAGSRLAAAFLLVVVIVPVWATVPNLRARRLFAAAAQARLDGNGAAFVSGAQRAAAAAPWEPFFCTQLAAYYGERYLRAQDPADQAAARDACAGWLRRALRVNPTQEYCDFNLGWLLLSTDPVSAGRHLRAAAPLSPHRGGLYLGIGLCELARRQQAAAVDAFALEWLNDPQAVSSPAWDAPPLAGLRGDVAGAVQRLASRWLKREPADGAVARQIRYVATLTDWWLGRPADVATLIRDGTPEQQRFFRHLSDLNNRAYRPDSDRPAPWERLYLAWRAGAPESSGLPATVRQRLKEMPDSFTRALTAPLGRNPGLIRFMRNERPGYSVLERNQDGFVMEDLYIYPENILAKRYASFLFPAKGYLPAGLLLSRLAHLPGASR